MPRSTVLFVDGESQLLRSAIPLLQNDPCEFVIATSADEAMAIVKSRPIDLIVAEEKLRGNSSLAFLIWVAETMPSMPSLMLTECPTDSVGWRAIEAAKACRVQRRPGSVTQLTSTLHQAIQGCEDQSLTSGVCKTK